MENTNVVTKVVKPYEVNPVIKDMLNRFYGHVKNNVVSTIELGKIIVELDEKYDAKEISSKDIRFFCNQVKFLPSSSQYRKLRSIGRHASFLQKYLEKMPSAVSTLYKITTLDEETAVQLINNNVITANTTLYQLSAFVDKKQVPDPVNELVIKVNHNEKDKNKIDALEDSIKMNVNAVFADVYQTSGYENCVLKINNHIVIDKKLNANNAPQFAEAA